MQKEVWLILFLAVLVEKDLGDLSSHLHGVGRLSISSPPVYAFKSGLFASGMRTEGIERWCTANCVNWLHVPVIRVRLPCYAVAVPTVFAESCHPPPRCVLLPFRPCLLSPAVAYHPLPGCTIVFSTVYAESYCCLSSPTALCYRFSTMCAESCCYLPSPPPVVLFPFSPCLLSPSVAYHPPPC